MGSLKISGEQSPSIDLRVFLDPLATPYGGGRMAAWEFLTIFLYFYSLMMSF